MPKSNKRKRVFVDNEVQSALARRIAIHWFIFVVVTFVFVGILQTCVQAPSLQPAVILKNFIANNALSLLIAAALLPVFVYDVIQLSNRFAGPIYRFRSMLIDIEEGKEVEPLSFREGDFWNEIAGHFNNAFELKREQSSSNKSSSAESLTSE